MRRQWLSLLLLLLAGCQVPDVQPFAEATTSMGAALNASLQQVATDFQRLDSLSPQALTAAQHDSLVVYQARLAAATKAFGAVPKALDDYAASLVAITDARTQGNKRIAAVTSALGKLAVAAGPWGQAVGIAAEPLSSVLQDLNDLRTLNSLSAKVAVQDSALQRIARYLASGVRKFNALDAQAIDLYANNMVGEYYPVKKYYAAALPIQRQALKVLQNIAELNAARLRLSAPATALDAAADISSSARQLASYDPALKLALLAHPPPTDKAYYAVLDAREAYYQTRLISPQLLALYHDAQQHLTAYYAEKQRSKLLLDKCAALLNTWAQSHRTLHSSLNKARYHPLTKEVLDQAQAIKKAADDIRALKLEAAD